MKKFYIALLAGCVLTLSTIVLVSCPAETEKVSQQTADAIGTSDPTNDIGTTDQTNDIGTTDPTTDIPQPPEIVYTEYISTQTPPDKYGFNTETKLPFGRYQFRGAYSATGWSGTYSDYFYDAEFADDGSTITLDGQTFDVVEIKEYWTNSSTACFIGCVLLNNGDTYLVYKYQFYHGTESAPKGYVNFWRTKAEFTGTSLPASAPAFATSKKTYYSDINYSVLYPEIGIRFDARHSAEDGMSYRWFDVKENTQYIINFQTHVTSASETWESLDAPVDGTSDRKGIKSGLYEQFCTMNTRPHQGGGENNNCPDYVEGIADGEIMYGELIFYRDEDKKCHLLFSKALADNVNQKPIYQVQDWLISDEMFNEVLKNFN